MPRIFYNDGEELIYEDLNAETAVLEKELYERVIYQMLQQTDNAFFGNSFLVEFIGSVNLSVQPGLGFQTDNTQSDPESTKRPIFSSSAIPVTLSAPDSVHDRIDLIVVKNIRNTSQTETRNYKDPITSTITTQSFTTETDWGANIQVVAGTPGNVPVAPSTPSGFLVLAQVYVTAVTGVADQSAITDERQMMPIGGNIVVNSSAFNRAPQSTTQILQTVLSSFDGYLTHGLQTYTDFVDQGSVPSLPASGNYRFYSKGGVLYTIAHDGTISPIGSGSGGGGGGANWNPAAGSSPLQSVENNEMVWLFSQSDQGNQQLTLFVKVPQGYISGRQIFMYLGQYSPSTSDTQLLITTANLIRKNLDAVSSSANQHGSTNSALTNTLANQYMQGVFDLTDNVGKINGFNVSPGDLIRVNLVRGTCTDTNDIRFIPSATEVEF
jgi:hypothetical protein